MIGLVILAAAALPHPGTLKTYQDWTVGCDNGRACQAVALVPDGSDDGVTLAVARGAAAKAPATVSVALRDVKAVTAEAGGKAIRLRLTTDGAAIAPADVPALIAAAKSAPVLLLRDAAGKLVGAVSLKGAAAALLYMDAEQDRIGTETALVRPGAKPASAVPPPPPLPVVVQPPRSAAPPRTLSVAKATALIGPDNARCDYATGKVAPEAHRLDAGHSLVLVDHPCGNGAYNGFTSAYVVDEAGRVSPAHFDADPGMGEGRPGATDWTDDPVNAEWDAAHRGLATLAKGRGLGDCGVEQGFAWDGTRFRLIAQDVMGECRGSTDYIPTWRAAVR